MVGAGSADDSGAAAEKVGSAPPADDPMKPRSPWQLRLSNWKFALKNAGGEFTRDQCTDLAAALTYYSVLSLFPALLALISLLGVFGQGERTVNGAMDMLSSMTPSDAMEQLRKPIADMVATKAAGFALIAGLLGALWSASGYVGAFGRALNKIYEVDEGRGMVRLRATQLLVTLITLTLAAVILLALVVSGPIARSIGSVIGLGDTAVQVWDLAKWPAVLILVVFLIALLYYATPNVKQPKFRWLSFGAFVAIVAWAVASALFGFYVSNFGSYNKTYGTLAGVIVFLLWLWITNLALLFGAEIDAEVERARQLQAGIAAEESIQLPPRDDKASIKSAEKHDKKIAKGRKIRERAEESQAADRSNG